METGIDVQYVYLLAKYGYRLDIGFAFFGISAGAEVGIGARVVDGHIRMETSGVGGDDNFGQVEWLPSNPFGIVADVAVEASVRLGPNFRFVVRPGFMTTFLGFTKPDDSVYQDNADDLRSAAGNAGVWDSPEVQALMEGYNVNFERIILTGRVGFSLS